MGRILTIVLLFAMQLFAQNSSPTAVRLVLLDVVDKSSSSAPSDAKTAKAIPKFGSYIARRIVLPYILEIEASANAAGKLQVEAIEPSGQRMKNVVISAPQRLEVAMP